MKKLARRTMASLLMLLMLLNSSLLVNAASSPFVDVPMNHWAYNEIVAMEARGVVNGVGNKKFNPEGTVTNAQFITMMVREFYPDELASSTVAETNWWSQAVAVAFENGLIANTTLQTSHNIASGGWNEAGVNANINRYDVALIMDNQIKPFANAPTTAELRTTEDRIADFGNIPSKYSSAVVNSYVRGLLKGVDKAGNFKGNTYLTRAQAATIMYRLIQFLDGASAINPGNEGSHVGPSNLRAKIINTLTSRIWDASFQSTNYFQFNSDGTGTHYYRTSGYDYSFMSGEPMKYFIDTDTSTVFVSWGGEVQYDFSYSESIDGLTDYIVDDPETGIGQNYILDSRSESDFYFGWANELGYDWLGVYDRVTSATAECLEFAANAEELLDTVYERLESVMSTSDYKRLGEELDTWKTNLYDMTSNPGGAGDWGTIASLERVSTRINSTIKKVFELTEMLP